MIPTVMKVFLSDDPSSVVEVPITPNTTAMDVIECCKEPGETSCHLAELWRGKERCVSENEKPYTILQQWSSHAPEVRFCLRHYDAPLNDNESKQPEWGSGDAMNPGYIAKDGQILSVDGSEMTVPQLKELAQKQQQQIDTQQQTLVGKEQRLRFLKQKIQQQQAITSENEKLRRLREKAEAQEVKLRKIRALRGKVEQQRYENTTMSSELEAVRTLFEEKHIELSSAMLKVQELTSQLDELRKGRLLNTNMTSNAAFTSATNKGNETQSNELEKLKKEMAILSRMNDEQQKRLDEQRGILKKRNEDASDLDRRIEELTNRLKQKKLAAGGLGRDAGGMKHSSSVPPTRMHTIVAAVEPLMKQAEPNVSGLPMKNVNGMYAQDLVNPSQARMASAGHGIIGRIDQVPINGLQRGQPEGNHSPYGQQAPGHNLPPYGVAGSDFNKMQENREFYQKAMPPTSKPLGIMRPQSAMAQLFPEPSTSKQESLTAKVRPMFPKSNLPEPPQPPVSASGNYYPLTTRDGPPKSPTKSASGGINLFAYKPPPALPAASDKSGSKSSNVTVLPSGNIKYTQSPFAHPPPPYPSNLPPGTASANHDMYGNPMNNERSITVDIEALRRKFAHAPRPLKKRSSITEPERPQGPVIPKLLYDQIYKKADTPFYRPQLEQQRSTPPPAYVEPPKAPPVLPKPNRVGTLAESTEVPKDAVSYESNITPTEFLKQQKRLQAEMNALKINIEVNNMEEEEEDVEEEEDNKDISPSIASNEKDSLSDLSYNALPPPPMPDLSLAPTKGILKPQDAPSKGPNRRIRFDPLALLLDASLEGEFDLVKKIIDQVTDSSGANDEGITALHNAVCAGHFDLVKFLVHYGSDINASDTDGWTPLHCAASCNNLPMCRFLVENGACIFAATLSDGETAADKCEEFDEGYDNCSEYLYSIQEKLGVVRQGQVYALYDYEAGNDDELSFHDGEIMSIVRKGDEMEREWWWARIGSSEGYVPRNLLGMWPRIKPNKDDHE